MTVENQQLIRQLWQQIWIEGDLDALGEIVGDPYVRHTRDGTNTTTAAGYAQHISSAVRTLRGTEVTVEHMSSDGDLVFARLTLHGVNMETSATVKLSWLAHYRIADGKVAESWTMHQAGLDW